MKKVLYALVALCMIVFTSCEDLNKINKDLQSIALSGTQWEATVDAPVSFTSTIDFTNKTNGTLTFALLDVSFALLDVRTSADFTYTVAENTGAMTFASGVVCNLSKVDDTHLRVVYRPGSIEISDSVFTATFGDSLVVVYTKYQPVAGGEGFLANTRWTSPFSYTDRFPNIILNNGDSILVTLNATVTVNFINDADGEVNCIFDGFNLPAEYAAFEGVFNVLINTYASTYLNYTHPMTYSVNETNDGGLITVEGVPTPFTMIDDTHLNYHFNVLADTLVDFTFTKIVE